MVRLTPSFFSRSGSAVFTNIPFLSCDAMRLGSRILSTCLLVVVANGCTADNKPPSQSVEPAVMSEQMADVDRKIAGLEKQQQAIRDEINRREALWRQQVSARHPQWSPDKRERQLAILSEKWSNSNRSTDADTVDGMKRFGSRIWHDLDLTEEDYWDITRALRIRIDRHDVERDISKQLEPLHETKRRLSDQSKTR